MAAPSLSRSCLDTVYLDWVRLPSPTGDSRIHLIPTNQPLSPTETNRSDLPIEMEMHSSIRYYLLER